MRFAEESRSAATGARPKNIRQKNVSSIIQLFRTSDTLSARTISDQTSLSKTSVNKILSQLTHERIIENVGKGDSTEIGGKKPDLFALNSEQAYFITIVFTAHNINAALLNLKLEILHSAVSYHETPLDREQLIVQLKDMVSHLLTISRIRADRIESIVLQSGGVINKENEALVIPIKDLNWKNNFPIRRLFMESLDFQPHVYFDNISRFFGYYELANDPSRSDKSLMIISTLESAVGGSILSNGSFDRGGHGLIGEFGHICVDQNSPEPCHCGNHGCFEVMVTKRVVFKKAEELLGKYPSSSLAPLIRDGALSFKAVFDAADSGDALAREVLDNVIQYFYKVLYNAIFMIDPDEIIVQNLYAYPCAYFREQLEERLGRSALWKDIKLTYSQTDEYHSAHIGAALYAGDKYFDRLLNR